MLRLEGRAAEERERPDLPSDLNRRQLKSMKRVPWTALAELKKDPEILKKIDEASALLQMLRKTLTS